MFKRLSLLLGICLHTLILGGVASKESCISASKAHCSLSDLFSPSTYKMSSSSVLKALGKFLPVIYQQGTTTSQRGSCLPCPEAKYHIGDFAEGGVIIYLTQDGNHGLVAAITDVTYNGESEFSWGPTTGEYINPKAYNNDPLPLATPQPPYGQYYGGYKNQNISTIANNLAQFPAFQAADSYSITVNGITYNDWFLPSVAELSFMYAFKNLINEVSLNNQGSKIRESKRYWSSRESGSFGAWFLDFFDGYQSNYGKDDPCAVRCVRAF